MKKAIIKEIVDSTGFKPEDDEFYSVYAARLTKEIEDDYERRRGKLNYEFVEMRLRAILKRGGLMWLVGMANDPIKKLTDPNNDHNLAKYLIRDLIDEDTGIIGAKKLVNALEQKGDWYLTMSKLKSIVEEEIHRRDKRNRKQLDGVTSYE